MKVLYFAWLRQRTGTGEEEIALPEGVRTAAELVEHLKTLSPGHARAFQDTSAIKLAIDQDFAGMEDSILHAREVAFFPPVTGG